MLNREARKPTATASPRNTYGIVATSVSENALRFVKAPWNRATNASTGFAPDSSTATAATAKPQASEIAGSRTASRSRRALSTSTSRRPGHHQPDPLPLDRVALQHADDAAAVDHGEAVGQRQDLVQLRRHQQHGQAVVPALHDLPVDELDRAHVDAARRLARDQHRGPPVQLPRHDHLLLVASGQRPERLARALCADVEGPDDRLRVLPDGLEAADQAAGERRLVEVRQDEVVRHRQLQDGAHAVAVGGDQAEAGPGGPAPPQPGDVPSRPPAPARPPPPAPGRRPPPPL